MLDREDAVLASASLNVAIVTINLTSLDWGETLDEKSKV